MLQTSLYASHQRILNLTADMNLDSSVSTSPRSAPDGTLRPWTPVNGIDSTMSDTYTPMTDTSRILEDDEDEDGDDAAKTSQLPKSKSHYHLSRDAATPGKDGLQQMRKTSDGPGISRQ